MEHSLIVEVNMIKTPNLEIECLPASVEKVAEIAGAEAAARVEAYNKEVSGEAERERMAAKEQAKAEQTAKEKAEQERIAAEQAARDKAEAERMERERMAAEQVEKERLEAEEQARLQAEETAIATPYHFRSSEGVPYQAVDARTEYPVDQSFQVTGRPFPVRADAGRASNVSLKSLNFSFVGSINVPSAFR